MPVLEAEQTNDTALAEGISVVIPVRGREALLARLLDTLLSASAAFAMPSEVIVVDSSIGEAKSIRNICVRKGAQYLHAENNVSRMRNLGIEKARFNVILFMDSDCLATETLLSDHWAAHGELAGNQAGVLGVTRWTGERSLGARVIEHYPPISSAFSFALWLERAPWGTCTNLSVRADRLVEIGGFDETMPAPLGGEDVDLGLRLARRGYDFACTSAAIVLHERETQSTIKSVLKKAMRSGRAEVYLADRHQTRITLEFPQFGVVLLVLAVSANANLFFGGGDLWILMLILPLWYFPARLVLGPWPSKTSGAVACSTDWIARMGTLLTELAFEVGKIIAALRRGKISRLWTKFVYLDEQLLAERERRIVQVWTLLTGLIAAMVALS